MKYKYTIFIFLLLLSGCKTTEYYKDEAADNARAYIFDNIEHVSTENTMFIKYTYPRILKKELFLTRGQEYNQYYLAWDLKNPPVTVMVFGTSHKSFRDWSPIRIIFREYKESDYVETTEEPGVWAVKPTFKDAAFDGQKRGNN